MKSDHPTPHAKWTWKCDPRVAEYKLLSRDLTSIKKIASWKYVSNHIQSNPKSRLKSSYHQKLDINLNLNFRSGIIARPTLLWDLFRHSDSYPRGTSSDRPRVFTVPWTPMFESRFRLLVFTDDYIKFMMYLCVHHICIYVYIWFCG